MQHIRFELQLNDEWGTTQQNFHNKSRPFNSLTCGPKNRGRTVSLTYALTVIPCPCFSGHLFPGELHADSEPARLRRRSELTFDSSPLPTVQPCPWRDHSCPPAPSPSRKSTPRVLMDPPAYAGSRNGSGTGRRVSSRGPLPMEMAADDSQQTESHTCPAANIVHGAGELGKLVSWTPSEV
jgi:hypothetical protein